MEVLSTVATFEALGGLLKGVNFCVRELIDIRRAWKDGPQDLSDFIVKVEVFQDALGKMDDIMKDNQKWLKQVKQLCRGVLKRLKSFIAGFSELLSYIDQSKLAKISVRLRWYWGKSDADVLRREITESYVMLNILVLIDEVCKNVGLIEELHKIIENLEKGQMETLGLKAKVEMLTQKNIKLKAKCNAEIKKVEDKMKALKRTQSERGMHHPEAALSHEAEHFIRRTLKLVVRENEVILGLDPNSRWSSSKRRAETSSSSSAGRMSSQTVNRESSSRPRDTAQTATSVPRSPVPPASSRRRSSTRSSSSRSFRQESGVDLSRPSRSLSQEGAEMLQVHPLFTPLPYVREEPAVHVADNELAPAEVTAEDPVTSDAGSHYGPLVVSAEDIASDVASSVGVQTPNSATEDEAATSPSLDVEEQEHCRKMEYDFNEHTENEWRKRRALLNRAREQAEAEARFAGRPEGRHTARALHHQNRLRRQDGSISDLR